MKDLTDEQLLAIQLDARQCFDAAVAALATLEKCILADREFPIWIERYSRRGARSHAIATLGSWYGEDGQKSTSTVRCLGVIGASPETLQAVRELNARKTAFKNAMAPLSRRKIMAPDPDDPGQQVWTDLSRVILRRIRLKRLKQRQLTRQLVILPEHLQSIKFSRSDNSYSHKRISQDEARQRLFNLGDDAGIRTQLKQLQTLGRDEVLVVVTKVPAHYRQNITYLDPDSGEVVRKQYKSSLPLFYLTEPGRPLPKLREPQDDTQPRQRRSIRDIEDEAFLPAIHAYRYRKGLRSSKAQQYRDKLKKTNN
ncbi:MAG: hypothetical protein AMJ53_08790 [Gammaproteobacteria bacterium SG8_11]|nr:MAG: hypothetical protein AMJ53_08790 [Gammaproteobacteria bacterium SG8_11]